MGKTCANCIYGRLICNKEKQRNYVGCTQFQSFDEKQLLEELQNYHYVSPRKDVIITGWIYAKIPFGENRSQYDTADAGVILNNHLISPKEASCDKFKPKY